MASEGQKMGTREQEHDTQAPGDEAAQPYSPRTMLWLKALVLGLGVLMLLAFAAMIVGVVRVRKESRAAASAPPVAKAASARPQPSGGVPAPIALKLPPNAVIRSIALSENALAVHYRTAAGEGVVIVPRQGGRQHFAVTKP